MNSNRPQELCVCEQPGYFYSGVPGVLAHVENGQLITAAESIERCDTCQRFKTDEKAKRFLLETLARNQKLGERP